MQRRHTRQKQIIQNIIEGDGKHMTAEEVMAVLNETEPGIGMATVYRNLNVLCEEGIIQKISEKGVSFYDGNPAPHDHLYCRRCGKVFDIDAPYDSEADGKTAAVTGARIIRHSTAFEGICQYCLKEEEKRQWN
jgi:Fur family ferric uptake transcriptional regulator/Fur family peroxide stress response transcriptional regulator